MYLHLILVNDGVAVFENTFGKDKTTEEYRRYGQEWRVAVGAQAEFVAAEYRSKEHFNGTGKSMGSCMVHFAKNLVTVARNKLIGGQCIVGGNDEELLEEDGNNLGEQQANSTLN